jgi:hypothetical protein
MQDYLADQIFSHTPLLKYLQDKAQIKKSGGASILVPLMYAKNGTFKWYNGYDTLNTTPSEGLTMGQYKWKNAATSISISGEEERQNSGEGQMFSLIKAKTNQAMLTMKDGVNSALYASSQVANAIECLPTLVDQTSTKGEISSTTYSWWQAQETTGGSFAGRGLSDMLAMYHTIEKQGTEGGCTDFIITDQNVFEYYERSQVPQLRYTNSKMADASFETLKYKGATMAYDTNCTSGVMYFLRSDNLSFVVHNNAMFSVGEFKKPVNQDARTAQIIFMGNLVTNSRRKLGKITTITA